MMKLLGETLLTLAALGGAAAILLVILAFTGGYSLIMFKTGSMHPTIPAGSVSLVQQIPASEVEIGDILTVDRENLLPVTHRVTGIEPGPTTASRTITMRGDANDTDDPYPYDITSARVTIASVPHLAHVIVWFGNPWVMAGITLGAASLVTWAFWPRDRRDTGAHDDSGEHDEQNPHDTIRRDDDGGSRPSHQSRDRHAAVDSARLLTVGLLAAAVLVLTLTPSAEASAADRVHDVLAITSNLDPGRDYELHGSDALFWDVDIDALAAPTAGELEVAVSGDGDERLDILANVQVCPERWHADGCSGTRQDIGGSTLAVNRAEWQPLLTTKVPGVVHLRLALTALPVAGAQEGKTRAEQSSPRLARPVAGSVSCSRLSR